MSKQRSGYSVLVRNLLETTTPDSVRSAFEKFGEIRDVYLPTDFFTNKPRGFGFVEFYKLDSAKAAVKEMDNNTIDGNVISVTPAQDRRKSPESMRRFNSRNQGSHIPYGKSHEGGQDGRIGDRHDWRDRPMNYDSHRVRRGTANSYYRSPRSLSMDRYDRYNGDRVGRYDLDGRPPRHDRRPYGRDDRYGGRDERRYDARRGRNHDRHDNYEDKWMGADTRRYSNRITRGDRDRPYTNRPRYNNRNGNEEKWRDSRAEGPRDKDQTMNLDNEGQNAVTNNQHDEKESS